VKIKNIQIGPLSLLLNQPLEGKTHQQDFLDKNGGDGINHVAFWVDDLTSERAKLVAKGIQIMFEVEGNCYFDTREDGNVVIQLLQRK
jgi:4-hydroxyphenylpyruvate dioxygenase-like putative hemolysin